MRRIKTILFHTIAIVIFGTALVKLCQGMHDEDVILYMSQSTYDEIVDTLTANNGSEPSEHEIVTYYIERYAK